MGATSKTRIQRVSSSVDASMTFTNSCIVSVGAHGLSDLVTESIVPQASKLGGTVSLALYAQLDPPSKKEERGCRTAGRTALTF